MPFSSAFPGKILAVAPMLDWTDRHYRYMARQISRHALLYTEMIHMGAILYGPREELLRFHPAEHPIALQLGGSDAKQLGGAARIAADYGYDEINLNCGCPSPRVQKGAFGVVLMRETELVSACLNEIASNSALPVTVKHRIGLDEEDSYAFSRDFVGELMRKTPCRTFIVHARKAWLAGVSPKDNRRLPPLRYDTVYRLKEDFPEATIILNGGVESDTAIKAHLARVDGVMVGREAYRHPWLMRSWDSLFFGDEGELTKSELILRLYEYAKAEIKADPQVKLKNIVRHYLGLMHEEKNARLWRRMLSDPERLAANRPELILEAAAAVDLN